MKPLLSLRALLSGMGEVLPLMLGVLNLVAGLVLMFLGTKYLLSIFGLIQIARPVWVGWLVDDLLGMGMSTKSSQAAVWVMTILGASLVVTSIDYFRLRCFKAGEARGVLKGIETQPQT